MQNLVRVGFNSFHGASKTFKCHTNLYNLHPATGGTRSRGYPFLRAARRERLKYIIRLNERDAAAAPTRWQLLKCDF